MAEPAPHVERLDETRVVEASASLEAVLVRDGDIDAFGRAGRAGALRYEPEVGKGGGEGVGGIVGVELDGRGGGEEVVEGGEWEEN